MKISLVVFICSMLLINSCQTQIDKKNERIACLKSCCYKIRSISPNDTNFTDLKFLYTIIVGKSIISLGEISHGDGSSFLAKTRIVKYLHQRHGFNVLLFESGLFDCYQAWQFMQQGDMPDSAFAKGVFPVWANSEQVQDLIQYFGAQVKTAHPLELAGFDFQITGTLKMADRKKIIENYFVKNKLDHVVFSDPNFNKIFDQPEKTIHRLSVDSLLEKKIRNCFITLYNRIDTLKHNNIEDKIMKRSLYLWERLIYFTAHFDTEDSKIMNLRDSLMGENILWFYQTIYPGKKLILWGANSHLSYNHQNLLYSIRMIPAGQFVRNSLGEKAYFILFTGFDGQTGSILSETQSEVPVASNKSLEYLLHCAGFQYVFLPIKQLKKEGCMDSVFVARPFGFTNTKAQWTRMADAFFFTNTILPNTKRKTNNIK